MECGLRVAAALQLDQILKSDVFLGDLFVALRQNIVSILC